MITGNISSSGYTKIMVIGGNDASVEVIDIHGKTCDSVAPYPTSISHATGGLIDGKPTVCGNREATPSCYAYNSEKNEWEEFSDMLSPRGHHASSTLPDGSWVITGGLGSETSSEYWNGLQFVEGPTLKENFVDHCQVRNTEFERVFLN